MRLVVLFFAVILMGNAIGAVPLVPPDTTSKEVYLQRASFVIERWQGVLAALNRAQQTAPVKSREQKEIANALNELAPLVQEVSAKYDLLRVADNRSWPRLKAEMQGDFRRMKAKFDRVAAE